MKTNNVINWFVVNKYGNIIADFATRKPARLYKNFSNVADSDYAPFRIAALKVAK